MKRVIVGLVAALMRMSGLPTTLRIGTEGYYPPFNYIDESGELKGFDIDIALALCT